jgi:hypothetical protein
MEANSWVGFGRNLEEAKIFSVFFIILRLQFFTKGLKNMSCPNREIQFLIDTIKIHRDYGWTSVYVPSLNGDQRRYLDEIGLSYQNCEPFCCRIDLYKPCTPVTPLTFAVI